MISALATSMEDAFGPLSPRPGAAPSRADATPPASADAESSFDLVVRAREGDSQALEQLCTRYFPRLKRWAHGRLPNGARGALDTNDLVQDTLMQVVRRLDTFEPRHDGAFQGYVRKTLFNRICDLARWHERRGPVELLATSHPAADPSPLEEAIGQEAFERYDAAMSRLRPDDRQAIIAKVEMALPYSEITVLLGKPTVAAAQMAVSRALVRLAKEMAVARGK